MTPDERHERMVRLIEGLIIDLEARTLPLELIRESALECAYELECLIKGWPSGLSK